MNVAVPVERFTADDERPTSSADLEQSPQRSEDLCTARARDVVADHDPIARQLCLEKR
jgi:hypothetical protein